MKITVVYSEHIRDRLREWLADLAAREPGGDMVARVATDLIRERLSEFDGAPPEAVDDRAYGRQLRWWQYSRGFWVGFTVRTRGFGP